MKKSSFDEEISSEMLDGEDNFYSEYIQVSDDEIKQENSNRNKKHSKQCKKNEEIPPHLMSTGKMQSLEEFRQRVHSYHSTGSLSPRDQSNTNVLSGIFESPGELENQKVNRPIRTRRKTTFHESGYSLNEDPEFQAFLNTEENVRSSTNKYKGRNSLLGDSVFYKYHQSSSSKSLRSLVFEKKMYLQKHVRLWGFLALIGFIAGVFNLSLRLLFDFLLYLRRNLITLADDEVASFFLWTAFTVGCSMFGILWTRLSPIASGSGISHMKAVLTGFDVTMYLPGYFTLVTLVAKVGGLILSVGSGLILGTEGAFVHIMSIITVQLLRTDYFSVFATKKNTRLQIFAAVCAVGVSSTFSAPIGGVLFSIEVTATYYLITNYSKAFISSVIAAVTRYIAQTIVVSYLLGSKDWKDSKNVPFETNFPKSAYQSVEFCSYFILGILMGCLSHLILYLIRRIAEMRAFYRKSHLPSVTFLINWVDPFCVAILTGVATYWPGSYMRMASGDLMEELLSENTLVDFIYGSDAVRYSRLVICGSILCILLCLSSTLMIPTGVWFPMFFAGASFGRAWGEFLSFFFPDDNILAGGYALAGAACLAASTTRTVSAAVIALEVTGQLRLTLPVFVSVLTAIGISKACGEKSVYDISLVISGLPYLPEIEFGSQTTAGMVMNKFVVYICKRTNILKILLALTRLPGHDIPIVNNEEEMILLGTISSDDLNRFVRFIYALHELPGIEIDLGKKQSGNNSLNNRDKTSTKWNSITSAFTQTGLEGVSFDQLQNTLVHSKGLPNSNLMNIVNEELGNNISKPSKVPFLMDDEKMGDLVSLSWSKDKKKRLIEEELKLASRNICQVKPMAITVTSKTSIDDVHIIFTMLRCDHVYVVDQGSLEGVLTTNSLFEASARKTP